MASNFEYSAVAIDHARNPRNCGRLEPYDGHARITGSCGDTMEILLQISDGRIARAAFTTNGCGSSLACGSMTTELAQDKTLEDAWDIQQADVLEALGGLPKEVQHCALLAVTALHAACDDFFRGSAKPGLQDKRANRDSRDKCESPPGTGDEPLSACQLIENVDGAVIVTTPQRVATVDVRKAVTFCRKLNLPVFGVVENMSGFVCPKCGEPTPIFQTGGRERMAAEMHLPFLGSIAVDPKIVEASGSGKSCVKDFPESVVAEVSNRIVRPILHLSEAPASNPLREQSFKTIG